MERGSSDKWEGTSACEQGAEAEEGAKREKGG